MELDPAVQHVYARALLSAAEKTGATDQVFSEADCVYRIFRKQTRLRHFLESPRIRKDEKHQLINRVFGDRIGKLVLNFIHIMLENNRIENLEATLRLVCVMVEESKGIIPATVTTAVPLTDEQRRTLQQTLESRLGLRFDIRFRVDPNILGGVVFKYRDSLIDGSVRFDLQKLYERLMALNVPAREHSVGA
ncbi:MAG: ATP synthase F1 subunit delta [Candidatus Sumerlaeia bacterium]|nr:ATP synthase F1 subunit delta [Candidatus Sumerlaeia bacterium]